MKTGELIGTIAKERGVSLRRLAIDAGVPYNTLYAIVKRKSTRIEPENLQRIATALKVSTAYLQGWHNAVSELEAVGMSVEDIATEMNIPVERIMEIVNSQEPSSAEAAEKIIRVASMLTKEATRNTDTAFPDMTGKTVTFQPFTDTDNQLSQLGGFSAISEFYKLSEKDQKRALEYIRGFAEYVIEKYKKQTDENEEKTPPQPD